MKDEEECRERQERGQVRLWNELFQVFQLWAWICRKDFALPFPPSCCLSVCLLLFRESMQEWERQREREREREREHLKQASHSAWSPTWGGSHNLRSWPEPKSRVSHSTDWATQALPEQKIHCVAGGGALLTILAISYGNDHNWEMERWVIFASVSAGPHFFAGP